MRIILAVIALVAVEQAVAASCTANTTILHTDVKIQNVAVNMWGNSKYTFSNGGMYWVEGSSSVAKDLNQLLTIAWQMGHTLDVESCAWNEQSGLRLVLSAASK